MLEFQRFDPAQCQFPRPRAPLLPALNWSDWTLGPSDTLPAALADGPGVWHFSRGRYALHAAYRSAGVGRAGVLLAPAYHCRTMLDPALALGGAVLLYSVKPDLTPDLESIRALIASSKPAARALIVPHYFGIEQPQALMNELAALCREHGIMLIEDCSHAWMVAIQRAPARQAATGRMIVASPYKFYACADGGILWGNPSQRAIARPSQPRMLEELKAFKSTFARRLTGQVVATVSAEQAARRGEDVLESCDQPSGMYSRDLEGVNSLALSRWVMRRTKLSPVVQQRRRHYRQWADAVAGLPRGRALFPELRFDCAPYMFPLLLSEPDPQFFDLKQSGMPIWRWDDMAVSGCAVAAGYRTQLLHLPCHQSLTAHQMDWMTRAVARVIA